MMSMAVALTNSIFGMHGLQQLETSCCIHITACPTLTDCQSFNCARTAEPADVLLTRTKGKSDVLLTSASV